MWSIIEERRSVDGEDYTAYGIKSGNTTIRDICADRKNIVELAERMNKFNASEINALDIVEDFIIEKTTA